jgi:hypothetical protein
MRLVTPLILGALFLGCNSDQEEQIEEPILLSARAQLIRLSVDLRGVHPSEEELKAIESNPKLYEQFVDRYLEDPRLVESAKQLFNHRYLTRTGNTYGQMVSGYSGAEVGKTIGEEPLELLSYIVKNDLPYSEIVTADYTMANPLLAYIWDLDYPESETGWQPAYYTDGRLHAGILGMNAIWQRYPSAGGNANRHRANAVSKMLLCDDYLARPVVINRSAVDQLIIDPEDAINTNAACQSCHSTLDPLAAHFYGWFPMNDEEDTSIYRPEREEGWRMYSNKEPAYFGIPTANIAELGQYIAEDERFVDCAVKTVMEGLGQRIIDERDWSEMQTHREVFVESELSIRYLIRSVVLSDTYKTKTFETDELADRIPTVKVVNPYQLSSIMNDLTGFNWTFNGVDALTNTGMGIPVLLGGLDGDTVTERNYTPSVGMVFVQERLAQAAGWQVASQDLDPNREGEATLLHYVTIEDTPDTNPEAFQTQIEYLYLRITGIPVAENSTDAEELMVLWNQLHSIKASPTQAWAGIISAVLRDPSVITY